MCVSNLIFERRSHEGLGGAAPPLKDSIQNAHNTASYAGFRISELKNHNQRRSFARRTRAFTDLVSSRFHT